MTEDEMVGWHHQLNGHGFGWSPGVGDGQGGLHAVVHGVAESRTRLKQLSSSSSRYYIVSPTFIQMRKLKLKSSLSEFASPS